MHKLIYTSLNICTKFTVKGDCTRKSFQYMQWILTLYAMTLNGTCNKNTTRNQTLVIQWLDGKGDKEVFTVKSALWALSVSQGGRHAWSLWSSSDDFVGSN